MAGFEDIMNTMGGAVNAYLRDMPTSINKAAEGFQIQNPFANSQGFQVNQMQSPQWRLANPFPNGNGFAGGGLNTPGFQIVNPFGGGNAFSGAPDWRNVYQAQQAAKAAKAAQNATTNGGIGGPVDPSKISDNGARALAQNTNQWRGLIESAAKDVNVDPDALQAIMMIESGGDPNSVSVAGAQGLMQVMPFHFSSGQNMLDPATNIQVGAQVFADGYKRYGDYAKAAAAYLGAGDSNGNPTSATDAYGTSGVAYAQKFTQYYQALKAAHAGTPAMASGAAGAMIQNARQFLGLPYVFGGGIRQTGNPQSGFDCSSFTGYIKGLPQGLWNAQAQYDAATKIDRSQLQPGDLVFFTGTYDAGVPATHVGIYIGNNQMISAIDSGVGVQDLSGSYWQEHWLGAGRL